MGIVVETGLGRVEGVEENGVQIFRGLPFAKPPVGDHRFQPPQPAEPWSGVRDASAFRGSAPQNPMVMGILPGMEVGEQDEDCLYLNVYTPRADGGRRPVMVWLHGGGFTLGSGSQAIYDGGPLVRRGDVVVVTINYRLGALGFLRLDELGASGNAGIEDQVAALRWVRENASAFGGDPDNVTLFGESAGGMSVGTLMGTPSARGLFHRAIPQSGAAHNVNDVETADRVAEGFLQEFGTERGRAEKLRRASLKEILEAQQRTLARYLGGAALLPFQPVLDGETLPTAPHEAVRAGSAAGVSLLVGCTRDEWNLFQMMDPKIRQLDDAGLLARMETRVGAGKGAELIERYRVARPQAGPPELFMAIETDRVFRIPAIRLAEAQQAHTPDLYQYLVTWESPALGGMLGACHGIEIAFVFGLVGTAGSEKFAGSGPEADRLSEVMMDAWLAFARDGAPGAGSGADWAHYDTDRRATMLLGATQELADAPFDAERAAWDELL
ncbi:MAG: carboxylesterase/lipase family protein [Proteobacteria bacterium]|nr:carboxylesterase/lipase family protein [Pseudomonadota bacterium]